MEGGSIPPPPGLWSRALVAVLRPSARGRPGARCLALVATELVERPAKARALHEAARLWTAHDRALLPVVRAYRGRRIASRGASTLAAFASPTDAVLCGMAVQEHIAERDRGLPEEERFSIRLSVHLGETRFRRGRLVGAAVDLARAVCGAAVCGEVWLTRSVQLAMNHVEVAVEPLTPLPLRAGEEPVRVYRARRSPGEGRGAEQKLAAARAGRLERVLEPVSDALASIEEGAAEGRVWAVLRVACATALLAALGAAGLGLRAALAVSGLAGAMARRRGGVPPRAGALSRWISAGLSWVRSRRAIPRAALIRPLW